MIALGRRPGASVVATVRTAPGGAVILEAPVWLQGSALLRSDRRFNSASRTGNGNCRTRIRDEHQSETSHTWSNEHHRKRHSQR